MAAGGPAAGGPAAGGPARSGLVLAGGASRRMGRDKALLVLDGERLVDRAVRLVRSVPGVEDVVVSVGARTIPSLDVPQVLDDDRGGRPALGPLAGLAAGLRAVDHPLVVVLACDLPDADPALLGALADRWTGQPAIIPSAGGRPQPLHAVWSAAAAPAVEDLLDRGARRLLETVAALGATVLDDEATAALRPTPTWWRNLNSPADLAARHTTAGGPAGIT